MDTPLLDSPAPDFEASMLPPSLRLRRRFDLPELRAHVERLLQRLSMRDATGCYMAMIDLNIALGPHGRALRAKLLQSAAPLLEPRDWDFLAAHLDSGVAATDNEAAAPEACLWQALRGTTHIVRARGQASAAELRALYRRGRRMADLQRTRATLLGRRVALPQLWEQTEAWLRQDAADDADNG